MGLFSLEHSKAAYGADFVLYGLAVALLGAFVLFDAAPHHLIEGASLTLLGVAGWTAIEYGLHRFVLHGLQPFKAWHAVHHERPTALICAPTILSATLIVALVFLPALVLGNLWRACALTLGVLAGYLAYAITHHATHHWRAGGGWLKRRKRWHALHHHARRPVCYGVTSGFWDLAFGSRRRSGEPMGP